MIGSLFLIKILLNATKVTKQRKSKPQFYILKELTVRLSKCNLCYQTSQW